MNKNEMEDELRPEYDVQSQQVRKMGDGRKSFCDTVRLEPDVIATFPSAEAVNEAFRYLIEVAKHSSNLTRKMGRAIAKPIKYLTTASPADFVNRALRYAFKIAYDSNRI